MRLSPTTSTLKAAVCHQSGHGVQHTMHNSELLLTRIESPRHSTLELTKHDPTAGAPERDNAVVAPEYRGELDAPQVWT